MPAQPHPTTVDYVSGSRYSSPRSGGASDDSDSERSDRSGSEADDAERSYRRASQTPPSEVSSPRGSERSRSKSRTRKPKHKHRNPGAQSRDKAVISFAPLPSQSVRTALILDRFSVRCPIMYCSNDFLLSTTACMGRSLYDFVARKDEELVRSWVDAIKGWGVNERGQPSDGGFGFGRFRCCRKGRDSR
jgi:hypothetical protein